MAVRNFYVTTTVDGREHAVSAGPAGEDGGFVTRVQYREDGGIAPDALVVRGVAHDDGTLTLYVEHEDLVVYELGSSR